MLHTPSESKYQRERERERESFLVTDSRWFFFIWRFFIAHNYLHTQCLNACVYWPMLSLRGAMVFRRAGLSAIFGLSCIVKADFCLSCTVQGIWPWSVKVKIMLVVHHPFVVHRAKFSREGKYTKSQFYGGLRPPPPRPPTYTETNKTM